MEPISLPSRGMGASGVYLAALGTTLWPPRSHIWSGSQLRTLLDVEPLGMAPGGGDDFLRTDDRHCPFGY